MRSATISIDVETWKLAAQITSTAVGLLALAIGFANEKRSARRFAIQLDLSKRTAEANVRPLLATYVNGYDNEKGLVLVNHGAGTAIIKHAEFRLGDRSATCAADLINLTVEIIWEACPDLAGGFYLAPHTEEPLLAISEDQLTDQEIEPDAVVALLAEIETQIEQMSVVVTYEDVLGNTVGSNADLRAVIAS